jgi:hypothetical protein
MKIVDDPCACNKFLIFVGSTYSVAESIMKFTALSSAENL